MPHTLYLGSGLIQSRLRDFDVKNSSYHEAMTTKTSVGIKLYRPSLSAIKSCMKYSIAELCITLFLSSLFSSTPPSSSLLLLLYLKPLRMLISSACIISSCRALVRLPGRCLALLCCFLESVRESWPPWQATCR